MVIEVRPAQPNDAEEILKAHFSAVHNVASSDYSPEIIAEWSTDVTDDRIQRYLRDSLPSETTLVAIIEGRIVGFGAIVEAIEELRAVYVHAAFGRRGVGSALLKSLEAIAKERGCKELKMDSSLTAALFYARHGYLEVERGTHTLRSGRIMECVKMRKAIVSHVRDDRS